MVRAIAICFALGCAPSPETLARTEAAVAVRVFTNALGDRDAELARSLVARENRIPPMDLLLRADESGAFRDIEFYRFSRVAEEREGLVRVTGTVRSRGGEFALRARLVREAEDLRISSFWVGDRPLVQ